MARGPHKTADEFHISETDLDIRTPEVLAYHEEEERMLRAVMRRSGPETRAIELGVGLARVPIAVTDLVSAFDGIEKCRSVAVMARGHIANVLSEVLAAKIKIIDGDFLDENLIDRISFPLSSRYPYDIAVMAFNVFGNIPTPLMATALQNCGKLAPRVCGSVWLASATNRGARRGFYRAFGQKVPDNFSRTGAIRNPAVDYVTRDFTPTQLHNLLSRRGVSNISIRRASKTGHFLFFSGETPKM